MGRYTEADRERVRQLDAQGVGYTHIARELGIPGTTVFRWLHPEYAEKSRRAALRAKKRRTGVCDRCGGQTKLNDGRHGSETHENGASRICVSCLRATQHEARYWTRKTIIQRLRQVATFLGRTPTSTDSLICYGAKSLGLTDERMAEAQAIPKHLRLPHTAMVAREFGSWVAATDAAGLPRAPRGRYRGRTRERLAA